MSQLLSPAAHLQRITPGSNENKFSLMVYMYKYFGLSEDRGLIDTLLKLLKNDDSNKNPSDTDINESSSDTDRNESSSNTENLLINYEDIIYLNTFRLLFDMHQVYMYIIMHVLIIL